MTILVGDFLKNGTNVEVVIFPYFRLHTPSGARHNEFMKRILPILVFFLLTTSFMPRVWAQSAVSPELYSAIAKKQAMDDALKGKDVTKLTPEELQQVVVASLNAGSIPQVGAVTAAGGIYTFTTGLTGTAVSAIPKGAYIVTVPSIPDVAISVPSVFLAASPSQNNLLIAMRQTNTTNKPINQLTNLPRRQAGKSIEWFKTMINKLFGKLSNQPSDSPSTITGAGETGTQVPATVQLFGDTNGNGVMDPTEKPVPWANVKITMRKISKEESMNLLSGTNSIRFETVPFNMSHAYDVVSGVVLSGAADATLIHEVAGVPTSVTYKGNLFYGEDFPIVAGEPYSLNIPQAVTLTLIKSVK